MTFDASTLTDHELVVLESTLRVQLAVAKHVRVTQVTTALGCAVFTGGFSALLACPSIVCSTVQRRKCRRRHVACIDALTSRNVALAPICEVTFAKRALALSIASGLTCCVLGVSLDVLVDGAVLQVVSFFFSSLFEDRMAQATIAVVHDRAADLVGRDQVYVVNDPLTLFGNSCSTTKTLAVAATTRSRRLVALPKRLWKSASWSFAPSSNDSVPQVIQHAKLAFRHRPSLRDDASTSNKDDDYASLFPTATSISSNREAARRCRHEYETLFGSVVGANATILGDKSTQEDDDVQVELERVESDAFALFGDCFVVQLQSPHSYSSNDDVSAACCVPIAQAVDASNAVDNNKSSRRAASDAFWTELWTQDADDVEEQEKESDDPAFGMLVDKEDAYEQSRRQRQWTQGGESTLDIHVCDSIDYDDNDDWCTTSDLLSSNRPRVAAVCAAAAAAAITDDDDNDAFLLFGAAREPPSDYKSIVVEDYALFG